MKERASGAGSLVRRWDAPPHAESSPTAINVHVQMQKRSLTNIGLHKVRGIVAYRGEPDITPRHPTVDPHVAPKNGVVSGPKFLRMPAPDPRHRRTLLGRTATRRRERVRIRPADVPHRLTVYEHRRP